MIEFTGLSKTEMLQKVSNATQIFKHDGTYKLKIKWDEQTGVVSITISVEMK